MTMVLKEKGQADVFEKEYPFYSIIEVASNNDPEVVPEDTERLLEFISSVEEVIHDGIVPSGETQAKQIWQLREGISVAAVDYGYTLKYDVSLDTQNFYKIVSETR
jgi:hypothetical protein